jgi:hypothetical protein
MVIANDAGPAAYPGLATAMESALAEWSKTTQCSSFDYHPDGGIQSFWCHRPSRLTVASVHALANVALFLSGPHKGDDLSLEASFDFGRYNPSFVRWLVDNAGPSPRDSGARTATQAAYDAHMKPLTEIFWRTYSKAQRDPACFAREKSTYSDLIAKRRLPKQYYERWFWFMNPYFCEHGLKSPNDQFYYDNGFDAGIDGNVTKTVIGFWLRRWIDGTMDTFAEGLKKLVTSYEPELLTEGTRQADTAALTKAIDGAVRAAAACRDVRAIAASTSLDVTVHPSGHLTGDVAFHKLKGTAQAACIAQKVAALSVPPFDGNELLFHRTVQLK